MIGVLRGRRFASAFHTLTLYRSVRRYYGGQRSYAAASL